VPVIDGNIVGCFAVSVRNELRSPPQQNFAGLNLAIACCRMKSRLPLFIMSVHVEARALFFQVNVKKCCLRIFNQLKQLCEVIISLHSPNPFASKISLLGKRES
jgi:hypothetical protein